MDRKLRDDLSNVRKEIKTELAVLDQQTRDALADLDRQAWAARDAVETESAAKLAAGPKREEVEEERKKRG